MTDFKDLGEPGSPEVPVERIRLLDTLTADLLENYGTKTLKGALRYENEWGTLALEIITHQGSFIPEVSIGLSLCVDDDDNEQELLSLTFSVDNILQQPDTLGGEKVEDMLCTSAPFLESLLAREETDGVGRSVILGLLSVAYGITDLESWQSSTIDDEHIAETIRQHVAVECTDYTYRNEYSETPDGASYLELSTFRIVDTGQDKTSSKETKYSLKMPRCMLYYSYGDTEIHAIIINGDEVKIFAEIPDDTDDEALEIDSAGVPRADDVERLIKVLNDFIFHESARRLEQVTDLGDV